MSELDFFKSILGEDIIYSYLEYIKKEQNDDIEIIGLIDILNRYMYEEKRELDKEKLILIIDRFIYLINCLIRGNRDMKVLDSINLSLYLIKVEKISLKILNKVLKESESEDNVISKIYLYLSALGNIEKESIEYCYNLLRLDRCNSKGIYFNSNEHIDIIENRNNMDKVYEYVKSLN